MSAGLEARAKYEASLRGTFVKQVFNKVPPIPSSITLSGKTAIVTGASSGLGEESARQLLQLNLSFLIIGARSQTKGGEAASKLQIQFPKARIEVWPLEMASYDSVREFAARCEKLDRLDIAILNAALGKAKYTRAGPDGNGHETTLQVNYLSTVLLTILLVPIMKAKAVDGAPGRITAVTSDMSTYAKLNEQVDSILDWADDPKNFDPMHQYGLTKLLLNMFISRLAEVVSPDDCIVNVVNPCGTRGTDLMRESTTEIGPRLFVWFMFLFMGRDLPDATRQYLHSALVLGKESHGSYCDWKIRPYPPSMYTETGRRMIPRLYDETVKELRFAGVEDALKALSK